MAKRKREPMSEGKKNIIAELIEEYDIKTAEDNFYVCKGYDHTADKRNDRRYLRL